MTATVLHNPYAPLDDSPHRWLTGNLHTHSTRSDGKRDPQTVIDVYAALGHGFLQLSDHDVLADYSGLDPRGMILISGNEVSASGPHILHVGARTKVHPHKDRQRVFDAIGIDGGFAICNHPNWSIDFDHWPYHSMLGMQGYIGVEIYNGACLRHRGSAFGVDKWDRLLSVGRPLWGFANDDMHFPGQEGFGWNVALVSDERLNAEGVIDALRRGAFYASSGVTIERIECEGSRLRVVAPDAEAMEVIGEHGFRLDYREGGSLSYDAAEERGSYVRVQCYGRGDRMAWTQPFAIRGGAGERFRELFAHKPVLQALRVDHNPALDDEEVWRQADAGSSFYRGGDAGTPQAATLLRCAVSPTHLVVRFDCDEPRMGELRTRFASGDPGMWADDCVEVFFDTEGDGIGYHQVIVNAAFEHVAMYSKADGEALPCACQGRRGDAGWSVCLSVPLAALGTGVGLPGNRIGFHASRRRTAVAELQFWSWVGATNHTPRAFGWLRF